MKRQIAVVLFSFLLACTSYASTLPARISNLLQRVPEANVGILVENADTGHILYSHNADHYFTPASNTKLFTAAAALLYLGPDFSYDTTIGTQQGNVYVVFSGDPTLTTANLRDLIHALKNSGVHHITGNVVLDTSAFSGPNYPLGWVVDDLPYCYAAPITSVILDQNCHAIKILHHLGGSPHTVPSSSAMFPINVSQLHFADRTQLKTCVFEPKMGQDNSVTLKGCLPNQAEIGFQFAITNPTLYATDVIQNALRAEGISLAGHIIVGNAPKHFHVIAEHHSATLLPILQTMLKYSDNVYAGALTKTLGEHYYGVGTHKAGVSAINAILQANLGRSFTPPYLEDGAGGSTYNLISPQEIAMLLQYFYHSKLRYSFRDALAISGQGGTLAYRLTTAPWKNHVYGKTGSMSGVSALSGYLWLPHRSPIIFSIMMNGIVGSLNPARRVQDQIVETL